MCVCVRGGGGGVLAPATAQIRLYERIPPWFYKESRRRMGRETRACFLLRYSLSDMWSGNDYVILSGCIIPSPGS